MRIAVLGAGISGLAAAHALARRGHEVTVFEATARPGGNVRTEEVDGCLVEHGPNGFLDDEPATLELVAELGLTQRLVRARAAATSRFVWRAGRLRALPAKPPQLFSRDFLPLLARLRILLEPFARAAPDGDETIHDFAARRLGPEAARILVDAFVTGVYAGDPRRLSVRSAFPKLWRLEARYGSLLKGARGRGFGPRGTLTSFDGGLQVLTDALAARVDVRYRSDLRTMPESYDRVVCTLPAPRAADLLPAPLGDLVRRIPTAPVAVVALVVDEPVAVPEAFGFLVPRGEGLRILGCLYDSSIFPRAPVGRRLFRVLVGGRRDPDAVLLDDAALESVALRDLEQAWGFAPAPRAVRIVRHRIGIAQYEVGHADLLAAIDAATPPWLRLAGSSYRGVSLNACVAEARAWIP